MKLPMKYEVLVIGLGNAGTMIAEEVKKRRDHPSIHYAIVSTKLDDLRKSVIKNKILLKEDLNLQRIMPLIRKATALVIVGEVSFTELWSKILRQKEVRESKTVYSFVIPSIKLPQFESDLYQERIAELSTRSLYIPMNIFKLYSKYSGNVSNKELEDLGRHFTKIVINSFLFLYDQFVILSTDEYSGTPKKLLREKGKMYFSLGSDSADSVREAYHSPLISDENLKSSRMKLLHVQFKKPLSLMTANMLIRWIQKYKIDIRIDSILMERNPKIEDVALTRLWLFE